MLFAMAHECLQWGFPCPEKVTERLKSMETEKATYYIQFFTQELYFDFKDYEVPMKEKIRLLDSIKISYKDGKFTGLDG